MSMLLPAVCTNCSRRAFSVALASKVPSLFSRSGSPGVTGLQQPTAVVDRLAVMALRGTFFSKHGMGDSGNGPTALLPFSFCINSAIIFLRALCHNLAHSFDQPLSTFA